MTWSALRRLCTGLILILNVSSIGNWTQATFDSIWLMSCRENYDYGLRSLVFSFRSPVRPSAIHPPTHPSICSTHHSIRSHHESFMGFGNKGVTWCVVITTLQPCTWAWVKFARSRFPVESSVLTGFCRVTFVIKRYVDVVTLRRVRLEVHAQYFSAV
jgi:hypothetical protein